ncbi:response regulator [Vibrio astriarenae]
MNQRVINCLVVDDHPLVCLAIKNILSSLSYVAEISTVYDATYAHTLLKSQSFELLILDVDLGSSDGFDFYRRAKAHGYKGKVLFVSGSDSQRLTDMAFRIGADGYICKSEDFTILRDAVDGIINGYTFFKFRTSQPLTQQTVTLSERETVVMKYLVQGKANKEIADILSISGKTVSTYKKRILDKYQVSNVFELLKVADT